ncbi:AAA family ATPase [Xanthocytophaga agilis]|uniref:AAA family ATPase n=1 Tax=Xanthocytophaga agilis TaxID=3048010 RepID=A0AAE3QY83_9BACT|nr:AAA family ATPase [Xanthocytophaga agilis]MDJ1500291.1 AAA family ATPase [Xanthocytophaga agilis]
MAKNDNPNSQNFNYITYGSKCNSLELEGFLEHVLKYTFITPPKPNEPPTPVCIWGRHGVGKTQIVRNVADKLGANFVYIAPAQFEEMGDLVGMPKIDENGQQTHFIPPDWVPRTEGPGIFLIDDVNRADDRILRGIMQLLQNYELVSWKMPPKWHIVLTANPDGGDYSVTSMDDAVLTRMLHITLQFEVQSWARWAEAAKIDPRGINFILTYPEMVTGNRTTPRSLVQFFRETEKIEDLSENLPLVKMLADASLDEETAAAFLSFVKLQLNQLISPEEIINAKKFDGIEKQLRGLVEQKTKRLDILSVISTRLINYLIVNNISIDKAQTDNLKLFLLLEFIPNDMRLFMAQELVNSKNTSLKKLLAIPEIGKLLLSKM